MGRKARRMYSALVLAACPLAAKAQRAEPAAAADAPSIDDIVVTARRREENIQTVPVAITAVTGEAIRSRTLSQLSDVQDIAPNVVFTESQGLKGTSRVFIRGVGENTVTFSADPAVGLYIDGIPLTRPTGSNLGLFDVERIEVLRGPQGTTFGKNTIGGSINFVTKLPGDQLDAMVDAKLGNYRSVALQGAVDLPATEDLSFRVSGSRDKRRGLIKNLFDGSRLDNENNWSLRGISNWNPNERWNIFLSADYFERDEKSNVPQLISFVPTSPLVSFFDQATFNRYGVRAFADAIDNNPFKGFYSGGASVVPGAPSIVATDPGQSRYRQKGEPNTTRQKIWGTYLIASYDLSDQWRIKSLSSYRHTLSNSWFDSFGTRVPVSGLILEENSKEGSQEVQLLGSGLFNGRVDLISGVFYGVSKAAELGTQFFEPELMSTGPFNFSTIRDESQKTTSEAAFFNATVRAADKLQLTLGARYTRDHKDFLRTERAAYPTGTNIGFGPAIRPLRPIDDGTNAPSIRFDLSKAWSAVSGVVALQYQWSRDVMTYVSWSRGFRSGGFSGSARSAFEVAPYNPEYVSSYEAGVRSSLFDRRLVLNVTGFWMDYTERQMVILTVDTTVTPFVNRTRVFNAGTSRQRGIEVEATARPIDNVSMTLAYGFTDAEYRKLNGPFSSTSTVAQDLLRKLPQTPRHTFNTSATYTLPGAISDGDVRLTGTYSYRSKSYNDVANAEGIAQKAYGLLGARISWTSPDRTFEAALWGNNLTDKRYKVNGTAVAGTSAAAYYGNPRTYGIEIRKTFR